MIENKITLYIFAVLVLLAVSAAAFSINAKSMTPIVAASSTPSSFAALEKNIIPAYAVQDGDTLAGIAAKLGVSSNILSWENGISKDTPLRPGQILNVSSISGVMYKVKPGDTVLSVADTYGVSAEDVRSINYIEGDNLPPKRDIFIPAHLSSRGN